MTATCKTCTYADEHGWWGPGHRGTHCRGCHRSWTSTRETHCAVCHAHFTGDGPAELHWCDGRGDLHRAWCDGQHGRPWSPRHTDAATVKGLYAGPDGVWSTSADRDPAASRERLARVRREAAA